MVTALESLTVQVSHVRWAAPGRGAIIVGVPAGPAAEPGGEAITVRLPSAALGWQTALQGDLWRLQGQTEIWRGQRQFTAEAAVLVRPAGRHMIEALKGPRFPGVGMAKAKALWDRFGAGLRDVLEEGETERLTEIVSSEIAEVLIKGWRDLNPGDVIEWLDKHRFPISLGRRLLDFYGAAAAGKLNADPYRLLAFGEGWNRVDQIATEQLGVALDDQRRYHAAVAEALYRANDREGSTALGHDDLVARVTDLLGDEEQAQKAVDNPQEGGGWLRDPNSGLYQSSGAWLMERYVAERLVRMMKGADHPAQGELLRPNLRDPEIRGRVVSVLRAWQESNIRLGDQQKQAVWLALTNQFAVISGGAGVGKTTVLKAIYVGLAVLGSEVEQMALAGRAAKRMEDATGLPAKTIARFLYHREEKARSGDPEKDPYTGRFDRSGADDRTYVVDEASMVDVASLYRILRWIGPGGRLLLVGDDQQLPPINAGLPFHELCSLPTPKLHLSQIYRQDGSTGIPAISDAIRHGEWPEIPAYDGPGVGVSVLPCAEDSTADRLVQLYEQFMKAESGDTTQVQILATTRGNHRARPGSVVAVNEDLYRRRLAGQPAVMLRGSLSGFCEGCPVLFLVNDPKRGLNNGSMGIITEAFPEAIGEERLVCEAIFDGMLHQLSEEDVEHALQRSFAITVHKSQGSQWNRVIVPVSPGRLLDRTLIYTAITRAVRQVVLVGDVEAAKEAVLQAPRALTRQTALASMMRAATGN